MVCQTVIAKCTPVAVRRATVQQHSGAIGVRPTMVGVPRRNMVVPSRNMRVSASSGNEVDVEAIVSDLQEKWDKVENKPAFIIYSVGAFSAIWLSSTIVGAINSVPLLPKVFELVGLGYSAWFTYRYLLFKSNREELLDDIEVLKKKIAGDN